MKILHKPFFTLFSLSIFSLFFSCASSSKVQEKQLKTPKNSISLLFAGDIMAHNVNYNMKNYDIIWEDIKEDIASVDFSFANIESPVDSTKPASNYPYFNMPVKYLQSAVDAGFNVFSLANNHTNDQKLNGILETQKTVKKIIEQEAKKNNKVYFAGTKASEKASFSYELIQKDGWKILFLPITEILNKPIANKYINFINPFTQRDKLLELIQKLKQETNCDLFILSLHTNETEYIRNVTKSQEKYYQTLLDSGVDIIWANHPHLIKNRKVINNKKIIMFANGNTISGQRTKPEFTSKYPDLERDNTGDGLLYKVIFTKNKKTGKTSIYKTENIYITTYITPKREYIIKKMNQKFIDELNTQKRKDWANYIQKRIQVNDDCTKELFE